MKLIEKSCFKCNDTSKNQLILQPTDKIKKFFKLSFLNVQFFNLLILPTDIGNCNTLPFGRQLNMFGDIRKRLNKTLFKQIDLDFMTLV